MCLLVVLRGFHASHPILVGANRDERSDRASAPPGLWVGERRRILSPRDREAGGTWLAVDDRGRFAGLTNWAAAPAVPGAPSRGVLPHLALDQDDLEAAVDAVAARVAAAPHPGFQLVLCDGDRLLVLRHCGGRLERVDWLDPVLVVTDEHGPGELTPRGLDEAVDPRRAVDAQLDALGALLAGRGQEGEYAICKRGPCYGTVSSSVLAVAASGPLGLVWRYAAGPPDTTPYRNYGNLGRRLLADEEAG
jgi:uncharacterized protein with NRDE domain